MMDLERIIRAGGCDAKETHNYNFDMQTLFMHVD